MFVGLNMQDARSDTRGFLREFEVSYPNVREPDDATARTWGLTGLPETYSWRPTGASSRTSSD